jgi:isocitrate/isopropylmalate dehydrogenase
MEVIIGSSKGQYGDSDQFVLAETEVMSVLGAIPRTLTFAPKQTAGGKLLVTLSEPLPPDTAVKIDHDDACLLGAVTGCWEDRPGEFLVVLKLSQYLDRSLQAA